MAGMVEAGRPLQSGVSARRKRKRAYKRQPLTPELLLQADAKTRACVGGVIRGWLRGADRDDPSRKEKRWRDQHACALANARSATEALIAERRAVRRLNGLEEKLPQDDDDLEEAELLSGLAHADYSPSWTAKNFAANVARVNQDKAAGIERPLIGRDRQGCDPAGVAKRVASVIGSTWQTLGLAAPVKVFTSTDGDARPYCSVKTAVCVSIRSARSGCRGLEFHESFKSRLRYVGAEQAARWSDVWIVVDLVRRYCSPAHANVLQAQLRAAGVPAAPDFPPIEEGNVRMVRVHRTVSCGRCASCLGVKRKVRRKAYVEAARSEIVWSEARGAKNTFQTLTYSPADRARADNIARVLCADNGIDFDSLDKQGRGFEIRVAVLTPGVQNHIKRVRSKLVEDARSRFGDGPLPGVGLKHPGGDPGPRGLLRYLGVWEMHDADGDFFPHAHMLLHEQYPGVHASHQWLKSDWGGRVMGAQRNRWGDEEPIYERHLDATEVRVGAKGTQSPEYCVKYLSGQKSKIVFCSNGYGKGIKDSDGSEIASPTEGGTNFDDTFSVELNDTF